MSMMDAQVHIEEIRVPLPPLCRGAFFGVGGSAIKNFSEKLEAFASQAPSKIPPKIRVAVDRRTMKYFSTGFVAVRVSWDMTAEERCPRATATNDFHVCVQKMQGALEKHLLQLRDQRVGPRQQRREALRVRWEEEGREYHDDLAAQRAAKREARNRDRAARGLELPARPSTECPTLRLRRGRPAGFAAKESGRRHRVEVEREKRSRMLRAWAALDEDGEVSAHARGRARGDARRLTRHARALMKAGGNAEDALQHLQACSGPRQDRAELPRKQHVPRRGQREGEERGQSRGEWAARLMKDHDAAQ